MHSLFERVKRSKAGDRIYSWGTVDVDRSRIGSASAGNLEAVCSGSLELEEAQSAKRCIRVDSYQHRGYGVLFVRKTSHIEASGGRLTGIAGRRE